MSYSHGYNNNNSYGYNNNSYGYNNNSYGYNNNSYGYNNNSYGNNNNSYGYNNNSYDEDEDEEEYEEYDEEEYEEYDDEDDEDEEEDDEEEYEEYEEYDDTKYEEYNNDLDNDEDYDRRKWNMGEYNYKSEEIYCKTCGEVHYIGDTCPDNKENLENDSIYELCSVCQDYLDCGKLVTKCLHCNAWFHKTCIKQCIKSIEECPCCRGDLSNNNNWLEFQSRHGPVIK